MGIKGNRSAPDYERIANKIVKVLFESSITYRETEEVLECVCCKLWVQHVQDIV